MPDSANEFFEFEHKARERAAKKRWPNIDGAILVDRTFNVSRKAFCWLVLFADRVEVHSETPMGKPINMMLKKGKSSETIPLATVTSVTKRNSAVVSWVVVTAASSVIEYQTMGKQASESIRQRVADQMERLHRSSSASTPGANAVSPDLTEQLARLANLKASGVLSDEEFAAAKARLLG